MQHISEIIQEKNIILTGADALSQKGFTQVPNHILESDKISPGAKLTYAMLLKYAWYDDGCYPGQAKLADDMGAGERSIRTYLKELEAAGLLDITQRGLGKTNLYRLLIVVKKGSPPLTGKIRRS